MKMREANEKIMADVKKWMQIEDESISFVKTVKRQCGNPVICLIMDIIESDSEIHKRVQKMILDSRERDPISMTVDEIGEIWKTIEEYLERRRKAIEETEDTLSMIKDKSFGFQQFLLTYLLEDMKKHDAMLSGLKKIKQSMLPYWGH